MTIGGGDGEGTIENPSGLIRFRILLIIIRESEYSLYLNHASLALAFRMAVQLFIRPKTVLSGLNSIPGIIHLPLAVMAMANG